MMLAGRWTRQLLPCDERLETQWQVTVSVRQARAAADLGGAPGLMRWLAGCQRFWDGVGWPLQALRCVVSPSDKPARLRSSGGWAGVPEGERVQRPLLAWAGIRPVSPSPNSVSRSQASPGSRASEIDSVSLQKAGERRSGALAGTAQGVRPVVWWPSEVGAPEFCADDPSTWPPCGHLPGLVAVSAEIPPPSPHAPLSCPPPPCAPVQRSSPTHRPSPHHGAAASACPASTHDADTGTTWSWAGMARTR